MPQNHLTSHERSQIECFASQDMGPTEIAGRINRSPSTVSRELQRNVDIDGTYSAMTANATARKRLKDDHKPKLKLDHEPLQSAVHLGLLNKHSPQQIAGRLKLEHPDDSEMHISHEAIYQWIYHEDQKEFALHNELRQHQTKRRKKTRKRAKTPSIKGRIGIEERPVEVDERIVQGHWEGDTIHGKPGTGVILTMNERVSRVCIALLLPSKHAAEMAEAMIRGLGLIALPYSKTMTLDNGSEFAAHDVVTSDLEMPVYFAEPYSPWQRGANENMNGLLRQWFPKGSDFSTLAQANVDWACRSLNNRPRRTLDYQTPLEVAQFKVPVAFAA